MKHYILIDVRLDFVWLSVITYILVHILNSRMTGINIRPDVHHPAELLAAKAKQREIGDGVDLTIILACQLVDKAEELIRMMGLRPSEIIIGYNKALNMVNFCMPWPMLLL